MAQVREAAIRASKDVGFTRNPNLIPSIETMAATRGRCDACGKDPRVLKTLLDGRNVCRTCLRVLRPPRPDHLATYKQLDELRRKGLHVTLDTQKSDVPRLRRVARARGLGIRGVNEATTNHELDRIAAKRGGYYEFHSKIRGVSKYQSGVARCVKGMQLVVLREPSNPHDQNAIALFTPKRFLQSSKQVGYLSAELAVEYAPKIDRGRVIQVFVSQKTGKDKRTRGVNILVRERRLAF